MRSPRPPAKHRECHPVGPKGSCGGPGSPARVTAEISKRIINMKREVLIGMGKSLENSRETTVGHRVPARTGHRVDGRVLVRPYDIRFKSWMCNSDRHHGMDYTPAGSRIGR